MNGICAAQRRRSCERTSILCYVCSQFDKSQRAPVHFPGRLCVTELPWCDEVASFGRSQGGADFRVGEAARDSGVTAVPKFLRQIAPVFRNQQFDESAGIEIDNGHD